MILKQGEVCLCDPIAVAPVLSPELVHGYYEVAAEVEITGPRTSGCIVFDWFETTNKKRRVKLISRIDLQGVVDQIKGSYEWYFANLILVDFDRFLMNVWMYDKSEKTEYQISNIALYKFCMNDIADI